MIKFVNTTNDIHKPYTAVESIEMCIADESSLPDILEAFENFLKASGYHFPENGYIDIVQDEESMVQYNFEDGNYKIEAGDGTPMFTIVE